MERESGMANIFYSLAGEGRGHAARAATLIDLLPAEHHVSVYTFADAYHFLRLKYENEPRVDIEEIPGLVFHYTRGRLDLSKSIYHALHYRWSAFPALVRQLRDAIQERQPDLAIVDFEPALPRAAGRENLPLLKINHQNFLLAFDLSNLPFKLRQFAYFMRPAIWAYNSSAGKTVVSSFFAPPTRRGYEDVVAIGPLIRPEVQALTPTDAGHLIAYLRPQSPSSVIDSLRSAGLPVHVYGLGPQEPDGPLTFHAIDPIGFVNHLASARAVVAATGNQIVGESLYLGKPFLGIPESNHHEQLINAHFLKTLGGGDWLFAQQLTSAHVRNFLDRLDGFTAYREHPWWKADGSHAAVEMVYQHLKSKEATETTSRT